MSFLQTLKLLFKLSNIQNVVVVLRLQKSSLPLSKSDLEMCSLLVYQSGIREGKVCVILKKFISAPRIIGRLPELTARAAAKPTGGSIGSFQPQYRPMLTE